MLQTRAGLSTRIAGQGADQEQPTPWPPNWEVGAHQSAQHRQKVSSRKAEPNDCSFLCAVCPFIFPLTRYPLFCCVERV